MDEVSELAELFKALSDPTRLRLVKILSENHEMLCVNALTRRLEVTQSAVSQHLRVLKQAGLVISERRGYHVHYALDLEGLKRYKAILTETLGENFSTLV
jgi:DNA-binding transcriptional ArsR family regulator